MHSRKKQESSMHLLHSSVETKGNLSLPRTSRPTLHSTQWELAAHSHAPVHRGISSSELTKLLRNKERGQSFSDPIPHLRISRNFMCEGYYWTKLFPTTCLNTHWFPIREYDLSLRLDYGNKMTKMPRKLSHIN